MTSSLVLLLVLVPCPVTLTASQRPNVLFLMTDQQRFDALRLVQDELSIYANKTKIRTPNLDRLAKQGAYFRNAYCQCPVCAPARVTIRTGCTIERTGVQHNDLDKEWKAPQHSLVADRIRALRGLDQVLVEDLGYVSEHYGKWHMPNALYNLKSSNTNEDAPRAVRFNDFDYAKKQFFFRDDPNAQKMRRYLRYFENQGEISSELEAGQQYDTFTRYPYDPNRMDARFDYPTGSSLSTDAGFKPFETSQPNVVGTYALSSKYTPSGLTGDVALRALQRLLTDDDERPWFLTVSFHNPHPPMVPTLQHLEYYWDRRGNLLVPPNINDPMDNADYDQIARLLPKYQHPQIVKEWTATYYALVEEIDDWIGKLLDELEASEEFDNTLIVFTSDHGEMLGAHGKREKNVFYEESLRVPLLLSYPNAIPAGLDVDKLVSHLDLFATILDYVGGSALDKSDGSSLRPLLENRSFNENYDENVVVAEWDFRKVVNKNNNKLSRRIDERPSLLVRKGDWKLMTHRLANSKKIDMMFDLESDPYELNNLLGKNAPTASPATLMKAEHLRCLLLEWMQRMDGEVGYYSDPSENYGEGNGDIAELRNRQSWPVLDFWVCDPDGLRFGTGAWLLEGYYKRNEYLYLGTRTQGDVTITSIDIVGPHKDLFTLEPTELVLQRNQCNRIKVTLECPSTGPTSIKASIRLTRHHSTANYSFETFNNVPILAECPEKPPSVEVSRSFTTSDSSTASPTTNPSTNPSTSNSTTDP